MALASPSPQPGAAVELQAEVIDCQYHLAIPAMHRPPDPPEPPQPDRSSVAAGDCGPLDSTATLLARVRQGDRDAVEMVFSRCVPILRRWARGRLPSGARGMLDTQDLVQDAVISTLSRLHEFEVRHAGGFLGFLREIVRNRIIDEARKVARRPGSTELVDVHETPAPSPLQIAIGREGFERYEAALAQLEPADRDAIVYRLELQFDYQSIAAVLGKPNANAARSAVKRAVNRLLEHMDDQG